VSDPGSLPKLDDHNSVMWDVCKVIKENGKEKSTAWMHLTNVSFLNRLWFRREYKMWQNITARLCWIFHEVKLHSDISGKKGKIKQHSGYRQHWLSPDYRYAERPGEFPSSTKKKLITDSNRLNDPRLHMVTGKLPCLQWKLCRAATDESYRIWLFATGMMFRGGDGEHNTVFCVVFALKLMSTL
jgi:hypothetical protein